MSRLSDFATFSFSVAIFFAIGAPAFAAGTASTTSLTVTSGGSTVTTVASGTVVKLQATVVAGSTPVAPGAVQFCDTSVNTTCTGGAFIATAQLTSAGQATVSRRLGIGTHTIVAMFSGTAAYLKSSSAASTLAVTGTYPSTTSLSYYGSAGNYYFIPSVTGQAFSPLTPTGSVSINDVTGSTTITSLPLAGATVTAFQDFANTTFGSTSVGTRAVAIAVGDFDGDGILDMAVVNRNTSGTVTVLLGTAAGSFQPGTAYTVGNLPVGVAAGDLNGDGILDLVVVNQTNNNVSVLLGKGDGTFGLVSPATSYPVYATGTKPEPPVLADVNGDGILDLLVSNYSDNTVGVLLGNGDGTFQTMQTYATSFGPQQIAVADFNGDGFPDLVVSNYNDTSVSVLLGNGDGTFQAQTLVDAGDFTNGVAAADFNGDGKIDLAVMQGENATAAILLGNGDGTFNSPAIYSIIGTQEFPFVMDVNGDGNLDIVCPSFQTSQLAVLLGNGDGTFQSTVLYAGIGAGSNNDQVMALGDFNGDGLVDFAVPNIGSNTVTVLTNYPTVTATTSAQISSTPSIVGHNAQAVYTGDANFAASSSANVTLSGNLTATTIALSSSASHAPAGASIQLTATLSPSILYGVSSDGEAITFYNGVTPMGTGILTSGVATFNTPGLPSGINTLEAVYTGDSYLAGSNATISQYMQVGSVTSLVVTSGGALATNVAQGSVVTLTASVTTGASALTEGTVRFCDTTVNTYCTGSAFIGTAQLLSTGSAVLNTRLGVGTHSLTATFLPTNTDITSTSAPNPLTVAGLVPSATTLQYHGSAGSYVLSPAVAALYTSSTSGSPTGSVQLLDTNNGNAILATSSLSSGTSSASATFAAQVPHAVGTTPVAIAVGDLNGDGIPDIVVANQESHVGSPSTSTISILLMNADGTVQSTTTASVVKSPNGVVIGDFNHDGKLDIAVTSGTSTGNISVLLGNGNGTFATAVSYTTVNGPAAIAAGDLDGDGILDLVVTSYTSPQVSVLIGNGDGTFQTQSKFNTIDISYGVTLADLNGDGLLDIVRVDPDIAALSVNLGNGDGTFGNEQIYATGNDPIRMTLGDFNGDGILDAAVTNVADNSVSVLLGNGDGTFQAQTILAAGGEPLDIVSADFDGDGKTDLAAINFDDNTISLFAGNGNGTFNVQQTSAIGSGPQAIVMGDFNGDGKPDIFTANSGDNTVSLLRNTAGVTITLPDVPLSFASGSTHIVEASYSGDTVYNPSVSPGISLTSNLYQSTVAVSSSKIFPSLNDSVTLKATLTPFAGSGQTTNGETIFFSANGLPIGAAVLTNGKATITLNTLPLGADSITASYNGDTYFAAAANATALTVTVVPATTIVMAPEVSGTPVASVAAGTMVTLVSSVTTANAGTVNFCDISVNTQCSGAALLGSAQIVSGSSGITTLAVRLGIGTHSLTAIYLGDNSAAPSTSAANPLTVTGQRPTFTALSASGSPGDYMVTAVITGAGPLGIPMIGTVNLQDDTASAQVASAPLSSGVTSFTQDFVPALTTAVGSTSAALSAQVIGDFNGDGIPDIIYTDANASKIGIATGIGDGTFNAPVLANTGSFPFAVAVGDFDNDGRLDAIVANAGDQTVWVLPGNGDGTLQPQKITTLSSSTFPSGIAVGDFNKDGNLDAVVLVDGPTEAYVTVLLGQGDGTFRTVQNTYDLGPLGSTQALSNIVIADVNNDGIPAILAVNSINSVIEVLIGNGDGTFQAAKSYATAMNPSQLAVADLNSDGNIDVIVATTPSSGVASVLLGNGDGTFRSHIDYPVGNSPSAVASGDFDGDGKMDIAVSNSLDQTISTLLGNGDGTLQTQQLTYVNGFPFTIAVSDLNGDGQMDMTVLTDGGTEVSALQNVGTISDTVVLSGINVPGSGTHQVEADYTGDSNYAPSVSTPISLATGTYTTTLTLSSSGTPASPGASVTLTATLSPYAGAGLTTNNEAINFYINGTTLLGSGNLTSGIATFTTTTLPSGSNSLTATYAGDTNFNAVTSSIFTQIVGITPVITWSPSTLTIYNGNPISAGVLDAMSATAGTFSYTATPSGGSASAITPATVLSSGTYTITATFTPMDTVTYATATATITLLISSENVWILNANGSLSELNDAGLAAASSAIIAGGPGTALYGSIAFDSAGKIWSANSASNKLIMADKTGASVTTPTAPSLSAPAALAVDGDGVIWVVSANNAITVFSNAGAQATPSSGLTGGNVNAPTGISIDLSGNVWIANSGNNSMTEVLGGAAPAIPLATATQNATLGTRP